jgi:hypothetical protein
MRSMPGPNGKPIGNTGRFVILRAIRGFMWPVGGIRTSPIGRSL